MTHSVYEENLELHWRSRDRIFERLAPHHALGWIWTERNDRHFKGTFANGAPMQRDTDREIASEPRPVLAHV